MSVMISLIYIAPFSRKECVHWLFIMMVWSQATPEDSGGAEAQLFWGDWFNDSLPLV